MERHSNLQFLDKNKCLEVYKKLLLVRLSEQKIRDEYFKDEMKTPVHLGIGQEAIAVGVQSLIPKNAKVFGTYRNHAIYLALSQDTDSFFAEMYGKVTGCGKGKAGSMHMSCPEYGLVATSAVVGTTVPVALGAALSIQLQKEDSMAVVFFGDGSVEEGAFWESVNFASLRRLPILFVCEDNDLAIHSKKAWRQGFKSFGQLMSSFNCQFAEADGTDVRNVLSATQDVLTRMKAEQTPGFLHLEYFRFLEHVGPLEDFKFGYRENPPDAVAKLDPIVKAKTWMLELGFSENELQAIHDATMEKINASVRMAQEAPFPQAQELYTDVYANNERYM